MQPKRRSKVKPSQRQLDQRYWRFTKGRIGMYAQGLNNIATTLGVPMPKELAALIKDLFSANDNLARKNQVNIPRKEK